MKRRICKNCSHRQEGRCHATGLKDTKEIRSFDFYRLIRKRFVVNRNDRCLVPERFEAKK